MYIFLQNIEFKYLSKWIIEISFKHINIKKKTELNLMIFLFNKDIFSIIHFLNRLIIR